jgi:hypothetical protein
MDKGVAAINIIPDRNWNIPDENAKAVKLENLYHVVDLADALDLPIIVGTEMNSFGQKRVDDFDAPELDPVNDTIYQRCIFPIWAHAHGIAVENGIPEPIFSGTFNRSKEKKCVL